MKVGFVTPGFSADETDWCIPAHTDIVRAFAEQHEVHVFTLRYPHRVDTYQIGRATVHSFGGRNVRGPGTAGLWRRVIHAVTREHGRGAFDVVHAIFGGEAGCVAVLCGRRMHVPSAVWLVDGELVGLRSIGYGADLNAPLRWMNAVVLRFADSILCGCDAVTETGRARMPIQRRAAATTLPLGVNTLRFFPAPRAAYRPEQAVEFINVGSLLPVKDQSTLLLAFARVLETLPCAHLTIAGTGPLQNKLRALASSLRIETRVTFAGPVPHDRMPALYQNADVFVQSSLHEGQGMALLEAAACGCALCGTDVGALRDMARGGAARSCPAGDVTALACAMVDTGQEHAHYSARAQSSVVSDYSLGYIVRRLRALYAQILTRAEKKLL